MKCFFARKTLLTFYVMGKEFDKVVKLVLTLI